MSVEINIGDFVTTAAKRFPSREAVYDVGKNQRFTYSELNTRANQLCSTLLDMGLEKGDRVAVLAPNGHEYMECFFGPTKAGLVLMPLNCRLTADELSYILRDGGAKALIFSSEFSSVVEDIRSRKEAGSVIENWIEIGNTSSAFASDYETLLAASSKLEPVDKAGKDDNFFIMYTSGTTGNPKGVVHTHESQFWAVLTSANSSDQHEGDRYLGLLPFFHVGATAPMFGSIYKMHAVVILPNFDPLRTWQLFESEKITNTLAVPAMLLFMMSVPNLERFDFSSLRQVFTGGAPVPVSTILAFQEMGIELLQGYGLTETCGPGCTISAEDAKRKVGSTGRPNYHTDVRIVDEQGNDVAPGESGEVLFSGKHIMKEYWNLPQQTAETIRDGWLHTGDIAAMDEDGFITIKDRVKDMIISGGENVYPAEIENVLLQHEQIADAAVIGQSSARWGESPLAVVVKKKADLVEADILSHCNEKLAKFKLPKAVVFTEILPRNANGKVLKKALREQFPEPALE